MFLSFALNDSFEFREHLESLHFQKVCIGAHIVAFSQQLKFIL
jgi:hypothetical protein